MTERINQNDPLANGPKALMVKSNCRLNLSQEAAISQIVKLFRHFYY